MLCQRAIKAWQTLLPETVSIQALGIALLGFAEDMPPGDKSPRLRKQGKLPAGELQQGKLASNTNIHLSPSLGK